MSTLKCIASSLDFFDVQVGLSLGKSVKLLRKGGGKGKEWEIVGVVGPDQFAILHEHGSIENYGKYLLKRESYEVEIK